MIDWYDNIEEPIRDVVKFLRNNGINTTCSCGHDMYIECDYSYGEQIDQIHNLLWIYFDNKNLEVTFKIELIHNIVDGNFRENFIVITFPSDKNAKITSRIDQLKRMKKYRMNELKNINHQIKLNKRGVNKVSSAFNKALAFESISDTMKEKYDPNEDNFKNVTHEELLTYAKTIAYKVFHNIKLGYKMDPNIDPILVDNIPAKEKWKDHYEKD